MASLKCRFEFSAAWRFTERLEMLLPALDIAVGGEAVVHVAADLVAGFCGSAGYCHGLFVAWAAYISMANGMYTGWSGIYLVWWLETLEAVDGNQKGGLAATES
jgi:hypothetical protein